jgi:trigger factor
LEELKLTKYIVQIPEERIDEEVQHMQKKLGNAVEVEDAVQLNDIVALDIFELEGEIRKEGGWTSNCVVLMEDMVTDEFKEIVLEKKVGDTIRFNVFKIEKDLSYEHVRKYFLNIEANNEDVHTGEWFEGIITKVSRRTQAEMDEEFFKKAFGQASEITNEAEARISIRSNIESYFGQETDKLLDIELVQNVVKKVNLYFPDTFLTKWLQASYEEWKKKSDHDLKHDLMHFKEGLSWKLIREAISSKANVKVEYPEIEQHAIQQMKAQYPGIQLPEESWKEFANRSLSNKDKAYEQFVEVLNNKVLAWLKEKVDIQNLEINLENFRQKVKEINSHDHH